MPFSPTLGLGIFLRSLRSQPADLGSVRLFGLAREALAALCREEDLGAGTLLLPSYICDDFLDVVRAEGQRVAFYAVRPNLEPDWDWLEHNTGPDARAFVLVHYFGFPNDIARSKEFCLMRGMLLIEDCAHSFLSRVGDQMIGTLGDYGIYSYRKTAPVLEGAALVSKNGEASVDGGFGHARPGQIARALAKTAAFKLGIPVPKRLRAISAQPRPGTNNGKAGAPGRMSAFSYRILCATQPDFAAIVRRRRANYLALASLLSELAGLRPVYPQLPEGVCPYALPVELEKRDAVLAALQARGVPVDRWPNLPPEARDDKQLGVAQRLAQHLLLFPVHQDLNEGHMRWFAESYRGVATGG